MLLDEGITKTPPKWIRSCGQVEKQSSHRNVIVRLVLIFQLPGLTIRIRFHAENLDLVSCCVEPTGNAIGLPLSSTEKMGWKMMRGKQNPQSEPPFVQDSGLTPMEPMTQKMDFFRIYNAQ